MLDIIKLEPKYADFKFWFRRETPNLLKVICNDGSISRQIPIYIRTQDIDSSVSYKIEYGENKSGEEIENKDEIESNILEDFKKYMNRPEYMVGDYLHDFMPTSELDNNMDNMRDMYVNLILGLCLVRAWKIDTDPDYAFTRIGNACVQWLDQTDFFIAPASSRYHDCNPGGLLFHTLKVYDTMLHLKVLDKFSKVPVSSIAVTSLTHDWCKIGLYESYMRNVKDEVTGEWKQVIAYRRNAKGIALGHGSSSMYLAERCFQLTPEEACAIRWHMGRWYADEAEIDDLQRANRTYPIVHMLQFADQLAIVEY